MNHARLSQVTHDNAMIDLDRVVSGARKILDILGGGADLVTGTEMTSDRCKGDVTAH